jgi:uncharacterized repeat protein (TIGR01451 family)
MKKLLSIILALSLTTALISFSACDEVEYADASKDANYTQEDVAVEVAYAYYRQELQQNYNQTMSRRNINPSPEEATSQHMIFLDCSSFVNAVYYEAFGENIMPYPTLEKSPQTGNYMNYAFDNLTSPDVVGAWYTADYTTEDARATLLNSVKSQLKPGDVIDYRSASAGHALIYVGDGKILHSMGNDFFESSRPESTNEGQKGKELNGTVQLIDVDTLFVKNSSNRYLFGSGKVSFCVLRPIARGLTTTQESQARMLAKGLDGEKTSNKGVNTALTRGEEVTYTLTLKNHRDVAYKNVEIKDVLDNNLTFVSGSDGVSCNGQTVTFTKEIKSGETITVSWTAKVKDTATVGTVIVSDKTTVQGVTQATIKHSVSKLSSANLQAVATKARQYATEQKVFANPIDMVESLYKDALNLTLFDYENLSLALDDIIDIENASIKNTNLSSIVAPDLYGGQRITKLYRANKDIIRLITTENLNVGDIIIAESDDLYEGQTLPDRVVYIYVGDKQVVSCTTNANGKIKLVTMSDSQYEKEHVLVTIFAYERYAVLRPSMASN